MLFLRRLRFVLCMGCNLARVSLYSVRQSQQFTLEANRESDLYLRDFMRFKVWYLKCSRQDI